jgi:hypothetical protein
MSVSRTDEPGATTIEAFLVEIRSLRGADLRSKAVAFNTQRFVTGLRQDGFSMKDIDRIFDAFVIQFVKTGQRPPEKGAYNLYEMSRLL